MHTIRPDTDIAAWLTAMARSPVAAEIVGAASQVEVHWDRLAALVENGAAQAAARRRAAARVLAAIPGVVAAGLQAGSASQAEAQLAAAKLEEAMRSEADARQAVADATSRVADLAERARASRATWRRNGSRP